MGKLSLPQLGPVPPRVGVDNSKTVQGVGKLWEALIRALWLCYFPAWWPPASSCGQGSYEICCWVGMRWMKVLGKCGIDFLWGFEWNVSLLAQGELEVKNMDMKPGSTLKITGRIADGADGFVINLGQGTDKLNLHFNPRFSESTIVCNSLDGSNWGQEQREDHLCFSPGSEVKVRSRGERALGMMSRGGPRWKGAWPGHRRWPCLSHQALPWSISRASCLLDILLSTVHGDL
uniref:Galectin n=1 Tax=Macaca mulatta TaxID=9544 RepID=A0A5F7Z942_MACMU